jgi:hypothetical protein
MVSPHKNLQVISEKSAKIHPFIPNTTLTAIPKLTTGVKGRIFSCGNRVVMVKIKRNRFFALAKHLAIGVMLAGVCMVKCTCNGTISETTENQGVMFIGDDVHYALLQYYEKSSSGTNPFSYNGKTLEEKWSVFINNTQTNESRLVFETHDGLPHVFSNLQDTTVCIYRDSILSIIKYSGEIQQIHSPKLPFQIGGWYQPYTRIIGVNGSNVLYIKNIIDGTDSIVDSSTYCDAQPWGAIYYFRGGYSFINGIKKPYDTPWEFEHWINPQEIVGRVKCINVYLVGKFNVYTGVNDTIFELPHDLSYSINSSASTIIYLSAGGIVNISKIQ